ncbi:MAG TPA: quinone-dependent dihydroorotate dehydrogenase [Thermodesulfobacteriota bacterium]|nr:quinone-dependent dihydroorotate dehydrogenase [Thermodesulfobacteriota bacterium]
MYKQIVSPILDHLDSETWHNFARESLHHCESFSPLLRLVELFNFGARRLIDDRLKVNLSGIDFDNPVTVGAGWDKYGRAVKALWHLGFSGVEVGTVVFHPQPGNPKPRQFMIAPGVGVNWLGFNSPGMDKIKENLNRYKNSGIPIGISIGKNKNLDDKEIAWAHRAVAEELYDFASYFAVNVSSPNTPGLRKLQDKKPLGEIIAAVKDSMKGKKVKKPVFIKIAPELTFHAIDEVIDVVEENKISGIIASNTTINTEIKAKYGTRWKESQGGLSGDDPDYRKLVNDQIKHIYKQTKGKMEIIGVGGINSSETALEKIKAGAKLLQLVTAIRGEGPSVAGKINTGLLNFMIKEGVKDVSELVGTDAD